MSQKPQETVSTAQVIARVLREEGVEHIFGVGGGSIFPVMVACAEAGIQIVHMRHEQAATFAADGYARSGRRPGVAFLFGGPGFLNAANGIAQAFYAKSPVVAIVGQHATVTDFRGPAAASYATEASATFTKWRARVVDERLTAMLVKQALVEATTYPPGPVVIEVPENVQIRRRPPTEQRGYLTGAIKDGIAPAGGDPDAIQKALGLLQAAQRPVVVAGEQVYWEDGGAELRELVEALRLPVITRRIARGMVPEDHPLASGGRVRGNVLRSADLVLLVGLSLGYLEDYGRWGGRTRFIQVQPSEGEVERGVPTELALVGNSRKVLAQMVAAARHLPPPPDRRGWLDTITELKQAEARRLEEEAGKESRRRPIHPAFLAGEVLQVLDPDASIIFDAFTGSAFLTERVRAQAAGRVLDTGEWITVGHGIGMGIGAQLARPGKQVFVMMGDGGVGIGGMDIETAVRYQQPVVYLINNNASWLSGEIDLFFGDRFPQPPEGRPGNPALHTPTNYAQLFAAMGCHTERVEEPGEIRAALARCLGSGRTSVLDVVVERKVWHPMVLRSGPARRWVEPGKMPEEGRRLAYPELFPAKAPDE